MYAINVREKFATVVVSSICPQCFKAHNRRQLDDGSNPPEGFPVLKGSGSHTSTSYLRNVHDLLLVLDGLGLEERKPEGGMGGGDGRRGAEKGKEHVIRAFSFECLNGEAQMFII